MSIVVTAMILGTYLLEAVNELLNDETFSIGSTKRMKKAIEAGVKMKEWIPLNMTAVIFFEAELVKHFKRCTKDGMSSQEGRESFAVKLHKLRSSSAFANLWKVFLFPFNKEMAEDPIFYQYLTRVFINNYIKLNFPIPTMSPGDSSTFSLTFEQSNALRYVAGYVCCKLYKKLKASKKDDLLLGLEDMIDREHSDKGEASASWVNAIDRGGLVHVQNKVHVLFVQMERVIQQMLRKDKASEPLPNRRESILRNVLEDSSIRSSWNNIGVELEEGDKKALLTMVATLYITIRGFSFAGSYVELYKQSTKKSLQGAKALRTTLNVENTKSNED